MTDVGPQREWSALHRKRNVEIALKVQFRVGQISEPKTLALTRVLLMPNVQLITVEKSIDWIGIHLVDYSPVPSKKSPVTPSAGLR